MKSKKLFTSSSSTLKSLPKRFRKLPKKHKVLLFLVLLVATISVFVGIKAGMKSTEVISEITEVTVQKQDITSSVTGSAVVKPKDEYSITALVSGDVLSANFEQGDVVEEGDILYEIDASDAQTTIENSNISYERSQMEYNKALDNYINLTVRANSTGVVKTLYVKQGDSVNSGSKIADIYDDSYLTLTLTFNDADAENFYVGQHAIVKISSNGETLNGSVINVNSKGYASSNNALVRTVKIKVENPGVLTNNETATATVDGFTSNSTGKFEYISEKTVTAESSGNIEEVYVTEGSRVVNSSKLVYIDSTSVSDNLKSSELSLKSSQLSRNNAQKKLEDYTITAPISGTVVTKNVKAGDKLDNSNMQTEMAVIYDMSSLECELSVDELDIKNVEVGQSVLITSDAVEGRRYNGEVSNISINGTTSGGVTTYPVTVIITDFDEDLLPGMNIDVEIITSMAKDVLAVPVSAVNRGNIVYVKGEKTDNNDTAPDGYKSAKVETGVYNNQYIEIVSGLSECDIVYVPVVKSSKEGSAMFGMMGGMAGGMPGGMPSSGGMRNGGGMPGGMR